jgi:predicted phage baseplate assembly protein
VGDEEWLEVPSLAESGPGDHHVMVQIDENQKMSFMGGDNKHGAAFPTGSNNISVRYRTGLGAAGNLAANALSVLAAPLPFVQSSRNPVPGNGGADAQTIEVTRQMAPVTVRTLDRAVTAQDFKELALTYPGIDKANARYLRKDGRPLIDLVVATTGGLLLNSEMRDSLTAFLQARSAPDHLVVIRDYRPVAVRLALEAHIRPTFLRAETGVTIQKALSTGLAEDGSLGYFNFDKRGLGENLYLSDVYALVESLPGVDFLIVKEFRKHASGSAATLVNDVLSMPRDGVATGGDATDTSIGILAITLVGGLA